MENIWLGVSEHSVGILVWLLWAAICALEALLASRIAAGRNLAADIVTGCIAALLGGYCSLQYLGDTPVMRLLVSVLAAIFLATAALWILGIFLRPRR